MSRKEDLLAKCMLCKNLNRMNVLHVGTHLEGLTCSEAADAVNAAIEESNQHIGRFQEAFQELKGLLDFENEEDLAVYRDICEVRDELQGLTSMLERYSAKYADRAFEDSKRGKDFVTVLHSETCLDDMSDNAPATLSSDEAPSSPDATTIVPAVVDETLDDGVEPSHVPLLDYMVVKESSSKRRFRRLARHVVETAVLVAAFALGTCAISFIVKLLH